MKKTLILSDNLVVIKNFIEILHELALNIEDFIFATSDLGRSLIFSTDLNIEITFLSMKDESEIHKITQRYSLVISLHCQQIFPKELIDRVRCINIHPGYLPDNRGWYPHVFSIINGLPAGVTIHEINKRIDAGPIIARTKVDFPIWYTSLELYNDILKAERNLIKENLLSIIAGDYSIVGHEPSNRLVLKSDFEDIKKIDINQVGSYESFINRLRGLTHENYKNAYFLDPNTNRKIYLRLILEPEN